MLCLCAHSNSRIDARLALSCHIRSVFSRCNSGVSARDMPRFGAKVRGKELRSKAGQGQVPHKELAAFSKRLPCLESDAGRLQKFTGFQIIQKMKSTFQAGSTFEDEF